MKKLGKLWTVLCLCILFLTGCGGAKLPEVIDTQTVFIDADGRITIWLVGEFEDADYNLKELTEKAVEEVSKYNADKGLETGVVVEKVETLPDNGHKAVVTYKFDNWVNCTEFIGSERFYGSNELFYGTVKDALNKGYGAKVILRSVKDNTLYTEAQLKQDTDKTLIATDVKANIYCSGRVGYISDGAVLNDDGSVDTTGVEGIAYILLK